MYQSFVLKSTNEKGIVNYPAWNVIKRNFQRENQKIVSYYQKNATAVKSDHLIVKLIESINIPFIDDLNYYTGLVRNKAYSLASMLKISSPSYKGTTSRKGYFFGSMCDEIIIADNSLFSISEATENWKDLQPIKVLYHGITNLLPPLLDGKNLIQKEGYVVISVNIPMLAFQYQMWRAKIQKDLVFKQDVAHFVRSYPIPNMIYSYQDIAIYNRLESLMKEVPLKKYGVNYHSFALIDDTGDADRVLKDVLTTISRGNYTYNRILETIPAINVESGRVSLAMPDLPDTRQVYWAMVLARLPVISFLLKVSKDNHANTGIKNDWRIALRELHYDNSFSVALTRLEIAKLWKYINENIAPYL